METENIVSPIKWIICDNTCRVGIDNSKKVGQTNVIYVV